jgi:hypothetical protein
MGKHNNRVKHNRASRRQDPTGVSGPLPTPDSTPVAKPSSLPIVKKVRFMNDVKVIFFVV